MTGWSPPSGDVLEGAVLHSAAQFRLVFCRTWKRDRRSAAFLPTDASRRLVLPAGEEKHCNGSQKRKRRQIVSKSCLGLSGPFRAILSTVFACGLSPNNPSYLMQSRMGQFSAQSAEREQRTAHFLVWLDVVNLRAFAFPHFGLSSFLQLFLGFNDQHLCVFFLCIAFLQSRRTSLCCCSAFLRVQSLSKVISRTSFRGRLADFKSQCNSRTLVVHSPLAFRCAILL